SAARLACGPSQPEHLDPDLFEIALPLVRAGARPLANEAPIGIGSLSFPIVRAIARGGPDRNDVLRSLLPSLPRQARSLASVSPRRNGKRVSTNSTTSANSR